VSTGYDNVGASALFILDAMSGNILKKVTLTGINDAAKISAWAENWRVDNVSTAIYGGDLTGRVWRVDLTDVFSPVFNLLATLKDASGPAHHHGD
jgi:type IV pilus assembly protein PilY1